MSRVTGTLKSSTDYTNSEGTKSVESQVTRAGETVTATISNARGDAISCTMDGEGKIKVVVERDDRVVESLVVDPTGRITRSP